MFHFNCVARNQWNADSLIEKAIVEEYAAQSEEETEYAKLWAMEQIADHFTISKEELRERGAVNRVNKRGGGKKLKK
jgi:hypothetical protein